MRADTGNGRTLLQLSSLVKLGEATLFGQFGDSWLCRERLGSGDVRPERVLRQRDLLLLRQLDLEDLLLLFRQCALVIFEPAFNEELFLALGRLVVNDEVVVVLEPIELLIATAGIVADTTLGLLLLDFAEEPYVGSVDGHGALVRLDGFKVDVSRQIPLTFEVHPPQNHGSLRIGHS